MPELVNFNPHPIEYTSSDGKRLDVSRYVYHPFPKMLFRADGATKIVNSEAEMNSALKREWSDKPFKRPVWDNRKATEGFHISEHHLAFLQSNGFKYETTEEAKMWFDALPEDGKTAFLEDAANWMPPVEADKPRRGRPPNPTVQES